MRPQPVNIGTDPAPPDFEASVTFIKAFSARHPGERRRSGLFKMQADIRMQAAWVAFKHQQVIATLIDDVLGNGFLAPKVSALGDPWPQSSR